jgi:two-component system sensor histidine kinase/response regulator
MASFSGARILLAEDEPINREIVEMLLADVGMLFDSAEDGEQAVELASRNTYDLILMDMQMPKSDGLEATRRIRQLPGCSSLQNIVLPANAFAEDKARCLAAGMNYFTTKAIDPATLYELSLKCFSGKQQRSD